MMTAGHWYKQLLHGPNCCQRTLLQSGRRGDSHTCQQQGDPCSDNRFSDQLSPDAQSVRLGLGALVGRG